LGVVWSNKLRRISSAFSTAGNRQPIHPQANSIGFRAWMSRRTRLTRT
jgi:hypothetical protein